MYRNYGDIVLYEGNDLDSKVIQFFTGSKYIHSALRVHRNTAVSVSRKGRVVHDLLEPKEGYTGYIILEPKEITHEQKRYIRRYESRLPNDYDWTNIWKLAFRHTFDIEPDKEDISNGGKFTCSSRMAYLYHLVGFPIVDGVNYSQIIPSDFLNDKFEVTRKWKKKNKR